jgi:hypothetical protein
MSFKVGDEVECIKDAPWKGFKDFCRVGDRGVLKRIDFKGSVEIFDMEITKGWNLGEIVPISTSNIGNYFKVATTPAQYKVGTRLVVTSDALLNFAAVKRGDVGVVRKTTVYGAAVMTQIEMLTGSKHVFSLTATELEGHFRVEQPNPCPPILQKWLKTVQQSQA